MDSKSFTQPPVKGIKYTKMLPQGTALVLEGGGTRGFYSAGVFEAFMDAGIMFPYIVGVSAGAIMLGRHWTHWDVEGDDGAARLFPCLGFVPFVFDAHGEKEDWAELKCTLRLLGPGAVGHGLSAGGFYSADARGGFTVIRKDPALFRNDGGIIVKIEE